jgi:hypothetical protein
MEFNIKNLAIQQYTPEQLATARQGMVDKLVYWFSDKYPKARLETLERNIAQLTEIHKYDEQCKICNGVQSCPSKDGRRMNGRLMPDGIVSIWFEPCQKGHRLEGREEEKRVVKEWARQ